MTYRCKYCGKIFDSAVLFMPVTSTYREMAIALNKKLNTMFNQHVSDHFLESEWSNW